MHQILVVGGSRVRPGELTRRLAGLFEIDFQELPGAFDFAPKQHMLIDVDLNSDPRLVSLKEWLLRKPKDAKIVFVTDKTSRLQEARAYALGATSIIHHPIEGRTLLAKLRGDGPTLATAPAAPDGELALGIAAATDALHGMFSAVCSGAPVDTTAVQTASDAIVDHLEAQGLSAWVETVRMHHSQTYQHCLLVTGVAGAFAEHVGVSRKDRQRLAFAGMLHDIGKARIPLAILEKPGRLDENELVVMRKHPEHGLDALRRLRFQRTCSTWWFTTMSFSMARVIRTAFKGARFPTWSAS